MSSSLIVLIFAIKQADMQAPKLPSFIRINKYKRFSYTPRYYDEHKERMEKLRRQYGKDTETKRGQLLSGAASGELVAKKKTQRQDAKQSALRVIISIATLLLLAYLIITW